MPSDWEPTEEPLDKEDLGEGEFDSDSGIDLDESGPDTETELEPEFKHELGVDDDAPAGADQTQEFTPAEAADARGDDDGQAVEAPDSDWHESEAPAEPPPPEQTEVKSPEEAVQEEAQPPQGEVETAEPVEGDTEEHDEDEQATEVVSDGSTISPAAGGVPPGMKPPPDYVEPEELDEKPKRPHLLLRFIGASLLVVTAFAAATSISLLNYLSDIASALGHNASLTGVQQQLESVSGGKPQTLLIIGSDRRYNQKGHGLSDTAILLRLDPARNAIALFSIPRDLKVQIPGYGTSKFNAAFSYGGPKLTLNVVRDLTGLKVNHLVNVDFAGFFYAINAIGCVFVDVDHHYYHSNAGLAASAQYAEIDIQPGYQRLCGENALRFVRYRHDDNDLVRSARQHDFLREARQKVGPSKLISDRKHLIRIFTRYTTSDINDPETMLQVLKLFLASRNAAIKEVHFPGQLGGNFVTAAPQAIHAAVNQFLGITGSPSPRGSLDNPLPAQKPETPPGAAGGGSQAGGASTKPKQKKGKKKKPKGPTKPAPSGSTGFIDTSDSGKQQAFFVKRKEKYLPVFYPTQLKSGTEFAQDPHVYAILHASGDRTYQAYKMVMKSGFGEYYGVEGTTWPNPPILKNPSETRNIKGRTYQLFYDSDRLRLVAWHTPLGTYWLNNTLLETLSEKEMLTIATTMGTTKAQRKPPPKPANTTTP